MWPNYLVTQTADTKTEAILWSINKYVMQKKFVATKEEEGTEERDDDDDDDDDNGARWSQIATIYLHDSAKKLWSSGSPTQRVLAAPKNSVIMDSFAVGEATGYRPPGGDLAATGAVWRRAHTDCKTMPGLCGVLRVALNRYRSKAVGR